MNASLVFRRAIASDATALAPLVLASGAAEFSWLLEASAADTEAFLRRAIARPYGQFSWKRHVVATLGKAPVAVIAIQNGRHTWFDGPIAVHDFRVNFGVRRTASIVRRGLTLESEIPPPRIGQILIQHCATHADLRGQGIFQALFAHVQAKYLAALLLRQTMVLDVLDTNPRAAALYRELGFRAVKKTRQRSRALPTHLTSTRMQWVG